MQIITDFTTIPDEYGKQAPEENKVDGSTVVSFPFGVRGVDPAMRYLHWAFTDDGSIPVCGFQWIHWSLANLPIGAVMFDPDAPDTLSIPADFSRSVVSMVPEAVQGRNSQDSRLVGVTDPQVTQRYTGPKPPNEDHEYLLRVGHARACRRPGSGFPPQSTVRRLARAGRQRGPFLGRRYAVRGSSAARPLLSRARTRPSWRGRCGRGVRRPISKRPDIFTEMLHNRRQLRTRWRSTGFLVDAGAASCGMTTPKERG